MNTKSRSHRPHALAAALLVVTFIASVSAQPANAPTARAGAVITIVVPPDAEIFFDGVTHIDADTLSLQARDRSVEGKAIPDTPEVRLKRVK